MDYLAILKSLDSRKAEASNMSTAVAESSDELNELNEKSWVQVAEPAENAPEPPPLATRTDEYGQRVLTVEAIPALAERLRLQGWKVTQRGKELICESPRGLGIQ